MDKIEYGEFEFVEENDSVILKCVNCGNKIYVPKDKFLIFANGNYVIKEDYECDCGCKIKAKKVFQTKAEQKTNNISTKKKENIHDVFWRRFFYVLSVVGALCLLIMLTYSCQDSESSSSDTVRCYYCNKVIRSGGRNIHGEEKYNGGVISCQYCGHLNSIE